MTTARHLTTLVAVTLVTLASGCFDRSANFNQPSATAPSSPTETVLPAPTAAPPKSPASSQASPPSNDAPVTAECNNPQTQAEINRCAQVSYEAADNQLNRAYQQLKNSLSPQEQDQLIEAEQAWIEFRDTNCEFESSQFEGGSIQPTIRYGCLEEMTKDRTAELQRQLEAPL